VRQDAQYKKQHEANLERSSVFWCCHCGRSAVAGNLLSI